MKKAFFTKTISVLLSGLISLQVFAACIPVTALADTVDFTVTPKISDGFSLNENSDLTVKGSISGELFTFEESKTLSFSVKIEDGWQYSKDYSALFEGDSTYVRVTEEDDVLTVTYKAKKGRTVPLSVLETVNLNATADKLATLYIEIDGRVSDISKDEWTNATFELKLGSKQYSSGSYGGTGRIKGRGNTSWQKSDQKPYSINLDEKASLCDIPETRKYALITTSLDSSLLRNYVMYKSALGLDGIGYTVKCEMINVYINNSNYGIYTLCERVAAEKNKIDIEEATPENITGGYVIEKNISDKIDFETEAWFNCPYQANVNEDFFTCKDPDESEVNQEMCDYLAELMQRLHDSVMGISDEHYSKYIDVESWIDFAIMQEIAKNVDGNLKTSCFMVKPENSEVISMTALWDFDYAFGNLNSNNASEFNDRRDCPNADTAEGFMIINSSNPWYKALYEDDEFKAQLCQTYEKYRTTIIQDMIDLTYEGAAYIFNAVKKDTKWVKADNVSESVQDLRSWIVERVEWLDSQWLGVEEKEEALPTSTTEEKKLLLKVLKQAEGLEFEFMGRALEDSFNNAVLCGKALLNNENAAKADIDTAAVEIIRLYGILTFDDLKSKTLELYADCAEAKGGSVGLSAAVSAAKSAVGTENIQEAWYDVTDALYGVNTDKDILEALVFQYEDISANDYGATTVRIVKKAIKAGIEIAEDSTSKQSEIDSALVAVASAFTGLSVEAQDRGSLLTDYLPYIIASVILLVAVIIIIIIIIVKIKKKKAAKTVQGESTVEENTNENCQ